MKNLKFSFAAVSSAVVIMLSGCVDYGTNLKREYGDFFKYSLGDYKMEVKDKSEETSEFGKRTWTLEYTNKAGVKHKDELTTSGAKNDEDNDKVILDFTDKAMAGSAKDQLYENVVKKYFPVDYKASSGNYNLYKGKGYTVELYAINTQISRYDKKKDNEKIKKAIDDDKGYKISTYDLKKYLSEKTNLVTVKVTLDSHSGSKDAKNKMAKMAEEFDSYAGKESTYSCTLYAEDDYNANGSFIYGESVLMGEKADEKSDYTTLENKLAEKIK